MKKSDYLAGVTVFPVVIAFLAAYMKSIWMSVSVVVLILTLVSIIPWCKRRENLWVFVWTGFCSLPVNWFLLTSFPLLKEYLRLENSVLYFMSIFEYVLVFTGIEELFMGLVCRMLFKRQYKLWIPLTKEYESEESDHDK